MNAKNKNLSSQISAIPETSGAELTTGVDLLCSSALAYLMLDKPQLARLDLHEVLLREPANPEAVSLLSVMFSELGMTPPAGTFLEQLESLMKHLGEPVPQDWDPL